MELKEILKAALLRLASDDYFIQEIEGRKVMPYTTLYFDTPDRQMKSD